tara:strand:+ start:1761 stop:2054 length:294 start_codon:yes stop_codon:yes gene_type:complete
MTLVVVPEFLVTPDNRAAFLAAARADAEASVASEDGCLQFDVVVDDTVDPIRVLFYEVYRDEAAFETHLETPHLAAFRDALTLCDEQPVRRFLRVVP